jgi:hypothetical protein
MSDSHGKLLTSKSKSGKEAGSEKEIKSKKNKSSFKMLASK